MFRLSMKSIFRRLSGFAALAALLPLTLMAQEAKPAAAPELPEEPAPPELDVDEVVEPDDAGFSAGLDSVFPVPVSFFAACL